mgnify:FL=1
MAEEPEPEAQAMNSETVRISALEDRMSSLERDLREVIHDVTALATLAGHTFGEPFRSQAHDIVSKRQVA